MEDNRLYIEMTWPEIKKAIDERRVLLFNVGSVEQHGPHLPTGVDVFLPMEMAQRAAKQVGGVVAPNTNYGYKSLTRTGGGPHFPASVNLRGTTLIALVKDIISEFIRHGWRNIVVIDWHYENHPFVFEGVDEAVREAVAAGIDDLKVLRVDDLATPAFEAHPEAIEFVFGGDFKGLVVEHASTLETSMTMASHPELVHTDKLVDGRMPQPIEYDLLPVPEDAAPESGVFDRATQGTPEKGERLYEVFVEALVKIIEKEFGSA